ncbi:MAG: hypothetical protein ABN479_03675 [Billgrantia sp.]|uniref:Uncharacterized protein n=1 Tax=Thioalkalivibrio sulfidiphilus (strain HL-EbGR7) TaxID=396588 RepID=B8GS11_THISH|nr:hypothetical protein [Thioalkalivibrio sulfidiphilus]ACL72715.1 conserved hypothetical protein [Thioalkalivibrio sulfidiphilus HL-EbGr7]
MALSKGDLKGRIISEMVAQGATATGEHSWVERLAEAIANAVVDEVTSNAEVVVSGGSSAGTYPVQ